MEKVILDSLSGWYFAWDSLANKRLQNSARSHRRLNLSARLFAQTSGCQSGGSALRIILGGTAAAMDTGQLVLLTLLNPREKFWGVLLSLSPAGVSLRGVDLESLDDFTQLVKSGEPANASLVFFPMHRVQRMEADNRSGELPSLAEQFAAKTGQNIAKFFRQQEEAEP